MEYPGWTRDDWKISMEIYDIYDRMVFQSEISKIIEYVIVRGSVVGRKISLFDFFVYDYLRLYVWNFWNEKVRIISELEKIPKSRNITGSCDDLEFIFKKRGVRYNEPLNWYLILLRNMSRVSKFANWKG